LKFFFILAIILIFTFSLSSKVEIAAYPAPGYSSETEFYLGAIAYLRYRPVSFNECTPKNIFYLSSTYSQKKQFNIFFNPIIHFQNGKYRWESEIQYMKWPSDFYGIGMDNDKDDVESFTAIENSIRATLINRLNSFWEIGIYYELMDFKVTKTEENGLLASEEIPGSENSLTSGIGIKLLFDDRNITSFPTTGNLGSLQINSFSSFTGSDYNFWEVNLDLRKYIQIDSYNTLALQTVLSSVIGDVPFNQMNYLDENMRAVTSKLFIDKNAFVVRAEDRFFFWQNGFLQRLGLAFFTEFGEVAPNIDKFNYSQIQFNYGMGFRYSFFLEDRMNVRLDIGFGEVKFNISIASGEAF